MQSRFPFSAVVGQDEARLALLLAAVDPGIGGVLLRGDKGSAKSTLARGLAGMLPGGASFVELPLGATEDRVLGTLDLKAALADGETQFRPGLLSAAHGGVLYVDEVNLLPDHLVDVLLDVAASGTNRVERDGVSHSHAARFVLVGSMNPEEGELRPQLLDRFGLSVTITAPSDPTRRAEIVRRRLTHDAGAELIGSEGDLVLRARLAASMPADLPDTVVDFACRAALSVGAEGLRADLVLCRAAAAFAGWEGRSVATVADVERVAGLALGHRRRRRPFDPPTLTADELDRALAAARQSFADAYPPEPPPAPDDGAEPVPAGGDREAPGGAPADDQGVAGGDADAGAPADSLVDHADPADRRAADDSPDESADGAPAGCPDAPPADGGGTAPGDAGPNADADPGAGRQDGDADPPPGDMPVAPAGDDAADPAVAEARPAGAGTPPPADPGGDDGRPPADATPTGSWYAVADAAFPSDPPPLQLADRRPGPVPAAPSPPPRGPRGQVVGDQPLDQGGGVALAATVRAAARRRQADPAGALVTADDLRGSVRQRTAGRTVVIAVDSSGSMGTYRRVEAATGTVIGLLADAYLRRDRVAMVTFRGDSATVVLPPTASVELARARLAELPTGGVTPLAEGISTGLALARQAETDGWPPLLVLITDGRATGDPSACERSLAAAAEVADAGVEAIVVDAEDGPTRLGLAEDLARSMSARHVRLHELTATTVEATVRKALRGT